MVNANQIDFTGRPLDQKVSALEKLNDADIFLVVTDEIYSLRGAHGDIVAVVASAIVDNEAFRRVIMEALEVAVEYKKDENNENI